MLDIGRSFIYKGAMKLSGYFRKHKLKPSNWAKEHNIPPSVISKYLNGKTGLNKDSALKIEKATNGEVTVLELLYPDIY